MKTILGWRFFAVLAMTTTGCSSSVEQASSSITTEADIAETDRATLDGFWAFERSSTGDYFIRGLTFNACVGLNGSPEIPIGVDKLQCGARALGGEQDIGSYLIHEQTGMVREKGHYRLGYAVRSGFDYVNRLELHPVDGGPPRTLFLRAKYSPRRDSVIELADTTQKLLEEGQSDARFIARAINVPSACSGFNHLDGYAFFGGVHIEPSPPSSHLYVASGGEWWLDDLSMSALQEKLPWKFDAPACSLGWVERNHASFYNTVCDGVYASSVSVEDTTGSSNVSFTETQATLPRFRSLQIGMRRHVGGDQDRVGRVITPLIDLRDRSLVDRETAIASCRAATTDTAACRVILSPHFAKIPADTKFVQGFERAVMISSGETASESCVPRD